MKEYDDEIEEKQIKLTIQNQEKKGMLAVTSLTESSESQSVRISDHGVCENSLLQVPTRKLNNKILHHKLSVV